MIQESHLRKSLLDYFRLHLGVDCFVAIQSNEGTIVSTSILSIFSKAPNRSLPNGKYGEIYGVYTVPSERCKGYATLLIKELINITNKNDLSFVELEASVDGVPVYSKCGFVKSVNGYLPMKYICKDNDTLK